MNSFFDHIALSPAPLQTLDDPLYKQRGVKVFIKRFDLIHPEITGNKWYKLKHHLREFYYSRKRVLLTFGGAYSNHIYATAAVSKILHIHSVGVIRGEAPPGGNPVLRYAAESGMHMRFTDREIYRRKSSSYVGDMFRKEFGDYYYIPEGGADHLGVKGAVEMAEDITEDFDFLCCAAGTGTMAAGLRGALTSDKTVIAFSALKGGEFLKDEISRLLDEYAEAEDCYDSEFAALDLQTDFHFGGYAKTTPELQTFIRDFYRTHGIVLDPVYTGKMMYGLNERIRQGYFKAGSTIVAIHSGGTQPLYNI